MGLVAVGRMFAGPFQIGGFAVNVPLNPEGVFGLAMTLVLAWRAARGTPTATPSHVALAAGAAALLSLISQARVLGLYFLSDDFILVQQANLWTWSNLVPVFTAGGGDGFFRPVGLLSLAVNATWAGTDPRVWHASALALHTANAALLTWLAARLGLSTLASFLAGALFAMHGANPEAVAWIAGRFDLLAVFFTLTGMLLFTWDQRWPALVCCACALWSKESAFVFPILLLLQVRRLRPTIPFFALTALAFGYRWILQGGIGGYLSSESGRPSVFSLGLATTAKVIFVRLWTSLYFPINWSVEPSLLLAVLALAMVAAILFVAARSKPGPLVWFALAALLVSILPPLHLLGGAADLSGGRLLYLPTVWFCLMLAAAVEGVSEKAAKSACVAALLAFHGMALAHNLGSWETASRQVRQICADGGKGAIPADIEGVPAFRNGLPECISMAERINAK